MVGEQFDKSPAVVVGLDLLEGGGETECGAARPAARVQCSAQSGAEPAVERLF